MSDIIIESETVAQQKYVPEIEVSDTDSNYIPTEFDEEVDTEDDTRLRQGCWQKFLFFIKHSYRDVSRHPCHFCLAYCSVLIAVLSTLIVNTVVDQGPVIFVSLAQKTSGEMDVWYNGYSKSRAVNMNTYDSVLRNEYINYTQITHLYGDEYNLAPRFTAGMDYDSTWQDETDVRLLS